MKPNHVRRDTTPRGGDGTISSGNRPIVALSFLRGLTGLLLALSLAGMSGCSSLGMFKERRNIGGVDFQGHCGSASFDAYDEVGRDVTCHSNINLIAACQNEYDDAVAFELKDPANPRTGLCYDRIGTSLGGIKNMTGHCGKAYSAADGTGDSRVRAELIGQTWQCRMRVDVSAVCAGQHNDSTLKAERVGKDWHCYRLE